jgi:hypothetical protein
MADIELRVLDTRIGARFNKPRVSDIIVGTATSLSSLIDKITKACGSDKISRLSICCHGYESGIENEKTAMSRVGGGFGLQLGSDDLTWKTVATFGDLNGKFSSGGMIDIYACAAAEDTTDGTGFTGNGMLLMRELAGHAGATVRASDSVQIYNAGVVDDTFLGIKYGSHYEGVDFGQWEGNVWLFPADGSGKRRVANPGPGVR